MYANFFEGPRSKIINSVDLSTYDNAYYKTIESCIPPLATRDQDVIRPYHLFLMYVLKKIINQIG